MHFVLVELLIAPLLYFFFKILIMSDTSSDGYDSDYDKCLTCGGDWNGYLYCMLCNSAHWRDNFQNWTSGDSTIDKLIRESQINATDAREVLKM